MHHLLKHNVLSFPIAALIAAMVSACQGYSPAGSPTAPSLPPSVAPLSTPTPGPIVTQTPASTLDISGVDPEISNWLRTHVLPLERIEPYDGDDFSDLLPLKGFIGEARIVALGEATHGTHEFFTIKHRLVRFLVQEMGFNIFAIEANWPEATRVNDFVLDGEGDPATALAGLHFWTWNTQELLDMIEWMHTYNQDADDLPVVSFHGFDMQSADMAMENVVRYFRMIEPTYVDQARSNFNCLSFEGASQWYQDFDSATHALCRSHLQAVMDKLVDNQERYSALTSSDAYQMAKHNARIVLQAEAYFRSQDWSVRDRYMAENVRWLLDQAGPDAKMIIWGHNAHVADAIQKFGPNMGYHLRQMYGEELIVFGFAFNEGKVNTRDWDPESKTKGPIVAHPIPPAPAGTFAWYAHSAGLPAFILNLKNLDTDQPETAWLARPLPLRSIGAVYDQTAPEEYFIKYNLSQAFDAIIYIEQSTSAQLLEPFKDR